MKIKPVKVISTPKYPDKYSEETHRVLMSAKPNRWLGTPLAAGMLAATVALSVSGCVADYYTDGVMPIPEGTASPITTPSTPATPDIFEYVTMGEPVQLQTWLSASLVPLFEYGEGTGIIGCVSVTAPGFFSEEEAFAVISAAFAEAGLTLNQGFEELENVNLPVTDMFDDGKSKRYATAPGSLMPDGFLDEQGLAVAFVSDADFDNWYKDTEKMETVSSYNIKKAAQTLAENNPGLVVFYDPVVNIDYDKPSDEAWQEAYAEAVRLLHQQAEAFIKWLGKR